MYSIDLICRTASPGFAVVPCCSRRPRSAIFIADLVQVDAPEPGSPRRSDYFAARMDPAHGQTER